MPAESNSREERRLPGLAGLCSPLRTSLSSKVRLAGTVQRDRLANERLERGLVNVFSFVDVDRAAYVSVEARVEETGRILQRCPLGEGPPVTTISAEYI
jgi:hypothetical protein